MEATANSGAIASFTRNFDDYAGFNLDKKYGLPFDRLYGHSPYAYPTETTLEYRDGGRPVDVRHYVVTGGNVHFCPTARQDYDLDSPYTVLTTIEHMGSGTDRTAGTRPRRGRSRGSSATTPLPATARDRGSSTGARTCPATAAQR